MPEGDVSPAPGSTIRPPWAPGRAEPSRSAQINAAAAATATTNSPPITTSRAPFVGLLLGCSGSVGRVSLSRAERVAGSGGGASSVGAALSVGAICTVGVSPARATASTKAPAVRQRSAGFLASAFSSTVMSGSGTSLSGGSGIGSFTCFISTAIGVSALNGTRPVTHA